MSGLFLSFDRSGVPAPDKVAFADRKLGSRARFWWVPTAYQPNLVVIYVTPHCRRLTDTQIQRAYDHFLKTGRKPRDISVWR